jgi:hypothetical protein
MRSNKKIKHFRPAQSLRSQAENALGLQNENALGLQNCVTAFATAARCGALSMGAVDHAADDLVAQKGPKNE